MMEAGRINADEDLKQAVEMTDGLWKCFWNFETEE